MIPSHFRRHKLLFFPAALVTLLVFYWGFSHQYQIRNTLSYATRPLWDHADGPTIILPHYYADGMPFDQNLCQLHGWQRRGHSVRVFDAVLMSSELDLLEIRMHELDAVVDLFFIVESNGTFTGLPKETYFANNRMRFSRFEHKIVYHFLPGFPLTKGQTAWNVEEHTRITMTQLLQSKMKDYLPNDQVLVIMSDVDEIPSWHSIALLKACDFGKNIHLQLRNFLYSFEWYLGPSSWRASVHLWGGDSFYRHSKSSNEALADSGWHCSYCFRTVAEYVVKMRGFSHSDRIGGNMALLEPKHIQDTICKGKDIFGMLPEAYSYTDLLSQMYLEPLKTAVGLPRFLIEQAKRFKFLLPGGCVREE